MRAGVESHFSENARSGAPLILVCYPALVKRALLLLALLAVVVSCRRHSDALRVRALYSAQSPAIGKLRKAEREFSFTDARLRSGKQFLVAGIAVNDPASLIADKTKSANYDLFILRSAAELPDLPELRKEMGDSFSVCDQSVAYIPEWVNEERREGAARFIQYLATHCR